MGWVGRDHACQASGSDQVVNAEGRLGQETSARPQTTDRTEARPQTTDLVERAERAAASIVSSLVCVPFVKLTRSEDGWMSLTIFFLPAQLCKCRVG